MNNRMQKIHLVVMACVAASSACYAPGQGPVARSGYKICTPAIEALAAYHAEHSRYPVGLEELVPRYLSRVPSQKADSRLMSIGYKLHPADSYELEFRYVGPGMNYCRYSPTFAAQWKCGGYY